MSSRRGTRIAVSAALAMIVWFVLRSLVWDYLLYVIEEKVVTLGSRDERFMISSRNFGRILLCKPEMELRKLLVTRDCDGLKVVVFDAAQMPFVTQNIADAWGDDQPAILTSSSDIGRTNHGRVCPMTFPRPHHGGCAAYPFANTIEAGSAARRTPAGADVRQREVPLRESRCQDTTLTAQLAAAGIGDGDRYFVVITHPDHIAPGAYEGIDGARDQSCG